jgi:hypothetical protein
MESTETPFLHARIVVILDGNRAIEMLAKMASSCRDANETRLQRLPDYAWELREHVFMLCRHMSLDYIELIHAAKEGNLSKYRQQESYQSIQRIADLSPASSKAQLANVPARFSAPTPPPSVRSRGSGSGSSAEFIQILHPDNNAKETHVTVKYTGIGSNFIKADVLRQFGYYSIETCQLRESHQYADGPQHMFVTSSCVKLVWYKRDSDDFSTEASIFYIVENLSLVAVILGDYGHHRGLDRPGSGMYSTLRTTILNG